MNKASAATRRAWCVFALLALGGAASTIAQTWTLGVTKSGTGNGAVNSSPAGITCGATCTAVYPHNTSVTLNPVAGPTSVFVQWTGACTGSGGCTVLMDADKSVNAQFENAYVLNVAKGGTGTGLVSGPGINCGADCTEKIAQGTLVTLFATPDPAMAFTGWSGDCTGMGNCTVTMSQARNVTATFQPTYDLTVGKTGTGNGTVSGPNINCGADCGDTFVSGTNVGLSAAPDAGSVFTGWSGDCTGTGPCNVLMSQARSVTANFDLTAGSCDPGSVNLNVSVGGSGSGSVTDSCTTITCPGMCTSAFANTATVDLYASADPGSFFAGWSGDCTGTGGCTVAMTAVRNVTATFSPVQHLVSVNIAGAGSGSVSGPGITCPGDCSEMRDEGTGMSLAATPDPGALFSGWSGACTGTGTCDFTVDGPKSITATFDVAWDLTVSASGSGTGLISSTPPGIDCGIDCSETYSDGASVSLSAAPDAGSVFLNWTGDCTGSGSCMVSMTAPRSVGAVFGLLTENLAVTVSGTGAGTVTDDLGDITCPGDCSGDYGNGTSVQLTATPDPGSQFAGWSGDCTGTGTCTVVMTVAHSVTATFDPVLFHLNVAIGGTGSGSVDSSPAGITCPTDCDEDYPDGTPVSLTATADPGSAFVGWGGPCTGTGSCNVTMDMQQNVTATFDLEPVCGDLTCDPGEDCTSCPGDCGACPPVCGDLFCDTGQGEDCSSCETDCGACPPVCGDLFCDTGQGEDCSSCETDCGVCPPVCGDLFCDTGQGEDCSNCASDCGACPPVCGDATCDPTEGCGGVDACPADCGPCDTGSGAQDLCPKNRWEVRAGRQRGAVNAITSVSNGSQTVILLGTDGSGVFNSADNGKTFVPLLPQFVGKTIYSVAATANFISAVRKCVFVGTDDGVWRWIEESANPPGTWTQVLSTGGRAVTALVVATDFNYDNWFDSSLPQHVYAAVADSDSVPGSVFFSASAGDTGTWSNISAGMGGTGINTNFTDAAIRSDYTSSSPNQVVFVTDLSYGQFLGGGGKAHVFNRVAGTWTNLGTGNGLPGTTGLTAVTLSTVVPYDGWLWVGTRDGRLFRSSNMLSGQNFTQVCSTGGAAVGAQIRSLDLSPLADPGAGIFDRLMVGTDDGLYESVAGGTGVGGNSVCAAALKLKDRQVQVVHFPIGYPADPSRIWLAGTSSGFVVGTNDPYSSSCPPKERSIGLDAYGLNTLAFSPNFMTDKTVYMASRTLGLLKSLDWGATWVAMNAFESPTTSGGRFMPTLKDIAISPTYRETNNPGRGKDVYLATRFHGVFRTPDGGWTAQSISEGNGLSDLGHRATALVISPNYDAGGSGDGALILGTQGAGVWAWTVPTNTWTQIGVGDCGNSDCIQWVTDLGLSNSYNHNATASGPDRTIYVATVTGLWRTIDGGTSWTEMTLGSIGTWIREVVVSPNYNLDGTAFAIREGVGIYRTTDFGANWTTASPLNPTSVYTIALSPGFSTDQIIYAATKDREIFWSSDKGDSWAAAALTGVPAAGDFGLPISLLGLSPIPPGGMNGPGGKDGGFTPPVAAAAPSIGVWAATPISRIYRSGNGGDAFTSTDGYDSLPLDIRSTIASKHSAGDAVLWAASPTFGVFTSFDNGASWKPFGGGHNNAGAPTVNAVGLATTVQGGDAYGETLLVGMGGFGIMKHTFSSSAASPNAPDYRELGITLETTSQTSGSFPEIHVFPDETYDQSYPIYAADDVAGLFRSTDAGATWTRLTDPRVASSDHVRFGNSAVYALGQRSGRLTKVINPFAGSGFVWSSSFTNGVSVSSDSGGTFTGANGTENNALPCLAANATIQLSDGTALVGLDPDGGCDGAYWSPDEGATTWVRGQGLDSTTGDVVEFVEVEANGDVLGVVLGDGVTTGGVYLSGDKGRHWIELNTDLDTASQTVTDIIASTENPVTYYIGTATDGVYANTLEADPYPTVSSVDVATGPSTGGTTVIVTGTGFNNADGTPTCTFGGVDATSSTYDSSTQMTCVTPLHGAGLVEVGVRNPDTRHGVLADAFTFTGTSDIGDLSVTKAGSNITISWTEGGSTGVYTVTRSDYADFSDPGATLHTFTVWFDVDLWDEEASGDSNTYYYKVE